MPETSREGPRRATITGVATYVPERVVTNAELARTLDTSDDWIVSRTGIRERRLAAPGETTASMGAEAVRRLMAARGLGPDDVDALLVATVTPDMLFPATACLIQDRLGLRRVWGFDLSAACSGFLYALKFSRWGSHLKRLRDPRDSIGHFLARAHRLGATLGPILVQLPPRWSADPARLEAFLQAAPRDVRWAFEFRDPSWLCEAVYATLARHGAALCIHDLLARHPRRVTAGWVYLRYHGLRYAGSYSPQKLAAEAARIRRWLDAGLDVYAYFNNDAGGCALANATDLRRYCAAGAAGVVTPTPSPAPPSPRPRPRSASPR